MLRTAFARFTNILDLRETNLAILDKLVANPPTRRGFLVIPTLVSLCSTMQQLIDDGMADDATEVAEHLRKHASLWKGGPPSVSAHLSELETEGLYLQRADRVQFLKDRPQLWNLLHLRNPPYLL